MIDILATVGPSGDKLSQALLGRTRDLQNIIGVQGVSPVTTDQDGPLK